MRRNRLGRSGIVVSDICMGTMTFGTGADEQASFEILDIAYDAGIDFYDTAEMHPKAARQILCRRTEEILGRWMKQTRDSLIIATKVAARATDGCGLPFERAQLL